MKVLFRVAAAALVSSAAGAVRAQEAPAEPPRVEAAFAKASEALKVGPDGLAKLGLLLQGWYTATIPQDDPDKWTNTFRLRRAEFSIKGEVLRKPKQGGVGIGYGLMIDPAQALEAKDQKVQAPDPADPTKKVDLATVKVPQTRLSILQDFWVSVLTDYADVSLGQFKTPVSWEGFNSSGALLFAERALVSRTLGDKRDVGLKIDKKIGMFYYLVAVFNGAGQNNLDGDRNKDVAVRLEVTPLQGIGVPGLMIGGMAYMTMRQSLGRAGAKDRFEADLRLDYKPILFQAEYIRAHDYNAAGTNVPTQGFYAALAWNITDQWQLAGRFGALDEDVDGGVAGKTLKWDAAAGVHYYLAGHSANLKLDWLGTFPKDTKAAPKEHQVIVAAQVRF